MHQFKFIAQLVSVTNIFKYTPIASVIHVYLLSLQFESLLFCKAYACL